MTELHVALWIPGPALTRRPGMTREKVIPGRALRANPESRAVTRPSTSFLQVVTSTPRAKP
jgi:hypothetical protein